jgi:hypothetical protein
LKVYLALKRDYIYHIQKSEDKNKQTISKLEKQQTKERKQNTKIYQT